MTKRSSCVALCALALSACTAAFEYPDTEPERGADHCQDALDNDFDGQLDCADSDCDGSCPEESPEACDDAHDNDGDGLTDASDPRCWKHSPPGAERCAEASGEDLIENFDLPSWTRTFSSWRRWGVGSVGNIAYQGAHTGPERQDPLVAFAGNTAGAESLEGNLGALVRQHPFSGSWQDFELSFSASVSASALLRAAIVPIGLAPSQDAPTAGADSALLSLTLDASQTPTLLVLDVEGARSTLELSATDQACETSLCEESMQTVTLTVDAKGVRATLAGSNRASVELRAAAPSSTSLVPSRLVFWGGSTEGTREAVLDDVRLTVEPEWPCGFEVPQVPGQSCEHADSVGTFGQTVALARNNAGEYCALVAASARTDSLQRGLPLTVPEVLTAWRSTDGKQWTAASAFDAPPAQVPEGTVLLGAGIAADEDGYHAAVAYRDEETVRIGFAAGENCGRWSPLDPGPALFDDAEAPSYVIADEDRTVYFTRPPTDQTRRTLWRMRREASANTPELLAELPLDVAPPVSVQLVGTHDLVLAYPSTPGAGKSGVGLLVSDASQRHWEPVEPNPVLELPPRLDLFDGQGRLAFDDRGVVSAALAWQADGGFLMYAGLATNGTAAGGAYEPWLSVGTARLTLADQAAPNSAVVPPDRCGDATCSLAESCSSCEADCPCVGKALLSDAFSPSAHWQLVSTALQPTAFRYLDSNPPGLSWVGGQPTWSVLPLDGAITADFELSFDMFLAFTDLDALDCSLYVGLGTVPEPDALRLDRSAAKREGIFAQFDSSGGAYNTAPLALTEDGSFTLRNMSSVPDISRTLLRDSWQHFVLRREGSEVIIFGPRQDGCGVFEQRVSYWGAVAPLPALLVGFGGFPFFGCADLDNLDGAAGTGGHGTLRNFELRLLDDPDECRDAKQRCGTGSEEPTCVDLDQSPEHCGACGQRCAIHETCAAGSCECVDDPGILECGDDCIDPMTSPEHCGGCGRACRTGEQCRHGVCAIETECDAPFELPPEGGSFVLGFPDATAPEYSDLCGYQVVDRIVGSWTPSQSGTALIEVQVDSNMDSVVAIGQNLACVDWLACNDDIDPGNILSSELGFDVEAGTTYRIAAGLWDTRPPFAQTAELRIGFEP